MNNIFPKIAKLHPVGEKTGECINNQRKCVY